MISKYEGNSNIYNFFFHPLHGKAEQKKKIVLAIITNLFITILTGGLWQILFWVVNRLDHKKVTVLNKRKTPAVNSASSGAFTQGARAATQKSKAEAGEVTGSGETAPIGSVSSTASPNTSQIAFGKAQWKKYFGEVDDLPLPPDIDDILTADCLLFPGKKVWETHLLVLVPEKVDGKPLTLESLGEMVKTPKKRSKGYVSKYETFSEDVIKTESFPSHWVLITKDVIGGQNLDKGSRGKCYLDQEKLVEEIATSTGIPYQIPLPRDVAVSFFMHHVSTGEGMFNSSSTYTRCKSMYEDAHDIAFIGGFASSGMKVKGFHFEENEIGVAAVRLFTSGGPLVPKDERSVSEIELAKADDWKISKCL